MGIPLTEIIARATIAPAAVIKETQLGHLKVGNPADIAIFRIDEGEYVLKDAANVERIGKKMLVNTGKHLLTILLLRLNSLLMHLLKQPLSTV
jgi:dihydroorotase